MPDQKLKIRNPPLKPEIIDGLAQLTSHYSGPDDPAVAAAISWVGKVVENEQNRLAMSNPSGRFQVMRRLDDDTEQAVYGADDSQQVVKMYLRMQKLGWKVSVTRDGRAQVIGRAGASYVISDEIDFDN